MPLLAEEDLMIGGTVAGRFRAGSFFALPALAPMLGIRVRVRLDVPRTPPYGGDSIPEAFELVHLSGEIRLAEGGPIIGFLFCRDRRVDIRTGDLDQDVELACQFDRVTLERLEQIREGKPLEFWLQLWPRIESEGVLIRNASLRGLRVPVSRDEWTGFLEACGFEEHVLFDLKAPRLSMLDFHGSARYLVVARERFLSGDYNAVVAECRKALECVDSATPAGEPEKSKLLDLLEPSKGPERARALRGVGVALKKLPNMVMHPRTDQIQFSRGEARLVLLTTASLVAIACETQGASI